MTIEELVSTMGSITSTFAAYAEGFIDWEVTENISMLGKIHVAFDLHFDEISYTYSLKAFKEALQWYLKDYKTTYSHADIDKGYWNKKDSLYTLCESWIRMIESHEKRERLERLLGNPQSHTLILEPHKEQAAPKPQQEKDEQTQTKTLPNELNTEEALRCFAKAIELGLMSENYEWKLKSKKSLIYFMGKMSEWLELSNRMGAVCWQPFVELFGGEVRNIASTYSKMTTEKEPLPKEADLINRVFEG